MRCCLRVIVSLAAAFLLLSAAPAQAPRLSLLFLGDNGPHQPAERFRQLQPVLAARGIDLTYTDKAADLNPAVLKKYDGLVIYANITRIEPEQEQALLDYVAGGKGLVPLHCASYCFLNSPKYIDLVGGQFQKHGAGIFRTTVAAADHPVMKGYRGFESWDETYIHTRHNEKDRTVLEYREDQGVREPWTWVRTHGQGRVFYTAWGHDARTWGHPGFHNLVERGLRWAVGADPAVVPPFEDRPKMTALPKDARPFQYVEANVPFYAPGGNRGKGEGIKQMQQPLEPAESMKHMVHPADLELRLFADESHLGGKPLCLTWDERGRLWVAVTVDYPNELQPEGKGRDRILIIEPTPEGKAGKVTVFADKLSIPTSMAFARGGLIVHQAPHTLFLKDTNGDDAADERRVLFTGWSTGDTHAGPSNLQYGLDNWLHGIVGYAGYAGTIGGERHNFRQGFYRFQPDGQKLEFLRNTNNNSWGIGISEEGLIFGSTANGNPSVFLPIPNRYYEKVRGWSSSVLGGIAGSPKMEVITDRVRQVDWHGQFTAAAGHALYTARAYPREYWNRAAFVAEPTGHIVSTFVLQPSGAGFTSRNAWNLLASNDEWTAPTMAEVGPDGNVWVIDWYNFIVQHNPTPAGFKTGKGNAYETPLRDKKHGRIYRLVARGTSIPTLSLQDAAPATLVAALKNDNLFWRRHAQRLLVERGQADVVPALLALLKDESVDAIGLNPAAIHALWTLHGLGQLDGAHPASTAAAMAALKHPSAGVRRNALQVLPRQEAAVKPVLERLRDADAQVRLAALLALAELPASAEAGAAIAAALDRPENSGDRWLSDGIISAAAAHDVAFLQAVAAGQGGLAPRAREVVAIVAEHYARGGPVDSAAGVVAAYAAADPQRAGVFIAGLAKGWPAGKTVPITPELEQALTRLLTRADTAGRGQLLKLAAAWGSKSFAKQSEEITRALVATLASDKETDEARINAARQLIEFNAADAALAEKVLEAVTAQASPLLAAGLIDAVGGSQAARVGELLLDRLAGLTPAARTAAVRVLVSRPEATRALLDGIEAGKAHITDLTLEQKQALAAHPDRAIAGRVKKLLERGGGLPSADREKVIQELLPLLAQTGDADAGKALLKQHCLKCHTHSGEGTKIGPDLTGMAAHPRSELLIHIMDPSRSVEGNYRLYTVQTTDGRVLSGMLASETRTSIELIDAEAKRHALQRDTVAELIASPKSLMPDGFEKQLTPRELLNLLEFLTRRDRFLPLSIEKAASIVSTRGMFYSKDADAERLILPDWSPRTVEGVPFQLVDPQGDRTPNVVLFHGPQGKLPPLMPKSVLLPCNSPARAVHLLSGVSGWGYPLGQKGSVSLIVRLHYADGKTEDHPLRNGEHFADYIRRVDVPQSKFAFPCRGQQMRFLSVAPQREEAIKQIELLKGPDDTAPVVMAVTVETR